MKTIRNLVPVLALLAVLIGLALGIGFLRRVDAGQQGAELVDNGSNAGLSNSELVSVAIANMMTLTSYHMEFSGPVQGVQNTLVADVQMPDEGEGSDGEVRSVPGSRYRCRSEAYSYEGQQQPAQEWELAWASDDAIYNTTDGGRSWQELEGPALFATGVAVTNFVMPWWYYLGPPAEVNYSDGNPRLEKINGTLTRHVAADLTGLADFRGDQLDILGEAPNQVELWISTGATPVVHRVVARGYRNASSSPPAQVPAGTDGQEVAQGGSYTMTWIWSRFYEDLGEVKPPPRETIK
jgi:hypothetical protein